MTWSAIASDCLLGSAVAASAIALCGTICNLFTAPRLEGALPPPPPPPFPFTPGAQVLPKVSLLIPARNEEKNLTILLPALSRISYPDLEILILDDGSSDATSDLVRAFAGPVRLVHGLPLPPGWLGKNWACEQLAAQAKGGILIFCDADVRVGRDAVGATVSMMRRRSLDALTCVPRQVLESWAEKAILPFVITMPLLAFLPMALVSRHPYPGLSFGCGQWFAFTRAAYDTVGGHASVRREIVEDMALGRRVKERGLVLGGAISTHHLSARMYRDFPAVWQGFSKNLAYLTGSGWLRPPAVLGAFLLLNALPFFLPFMGSGFGGVPLAFWLIVRLSTSITFREPLFGWLWSPIGIALIPLIAARSWLGYRRGNVTWKGRTLSAAFAKPERGAGVNDLPGTLSLSAGLSLSQRTIE